VFALGSDRRTRPTGRRVTGGWPLHRRAAASWAAVAPLARPESTKPFTPSLTPAPGPSQPCSLLPDTAPSKPGRLLAPRWISSVALLHPTWPSQPAARRHPVRPTPPGDVLLWVDVFKSCWYIVVTVLVEKCRKQEQAEPGWGAKLARPGVGRSRCSAGEHLHRRY